MKKVHAVFAFGACFLLVSRALSDPPMINLAAQYPTVTLSCTGKGIPPAKVVGEKGWPNPPIATTRICTGPGQCFTTHTPCWPYSCDTTAKTCKTSCADSSECGALGLCLAGQCQPRPGSYCVPGQGRMTLDGTTRLSTAPYACNPDTGVAYSRCENQGQCESHFSCGSDGTCK